MTKHKLLLAIFSSILVCHSIAADADMTEYQLLSDRRPKLVFPHYTVADKKLIVDQVRLIMNEIFVHRDLKIQDFGQDADANPWLDKIEKKIDTLSEADFHSQIADIFNRQRDLHTWYSFPIPYACYKSFLPFSLKQVTLPDNTSSIAIQSIIDSDDVLKLLPKNLPFRVGDTLISYDGMTVKQAIENLAPRSRGANPAAGLRRSINLMSLISQKFMLPPVSDTIDLTFENRQGRAYSITIPWLSKLDIKCATPTPPIPVVTTPLSKDGEDDYLIDFNRLYRPSNKTRKSSLNTNGLKDTEEPTLKYKIINNEFGRYGYLKLESFKPETLSSDATIEEVRKILFKDFANTDGLIFDLRDNGGGEINFAEKMIQLFTPLNPDPLLFRLKNSAANRFYTQKVANSSPFTQALLNAEDNHLPFAADLPLSFDLSGIGQYYFRPVAILNNASCYSSCDMFSAQIQDHSAGILFGEDANTGAGGANNVNHDKFTSDLIKEEGTPFTKLPNGQNIGFSWRQVVRVGKNAGQLVEDVGVKSDYIVPTTLEDLYNSSSEQFRAITKILSEKSPSNISSVRLKYDSLQDILLNQSPSFFASWENTDELKFVIEDQWTVSSLIETNNIMGRNISLPDSIKTSEYGFGKVEVLGFNAGVRVWRKIINYRIIPDFLSLAEDQIIASDFSDQDKNPFTLYTQNVETEEGWVIRDGALKIGTASTYLNNVHTEATLFLNMPVKPFRLNFDASIKSEKNYDFFKVLIRLDGKDIPLLEKISGDIESKKYTYDLTAYRGKKIEIRFVFDSDGGQADSGPVLDNIVLAPIP